TEDMLKREHEAAVPGAPQSQAPVTTTVINIPSETAVPDHIVWSLFNTIFMNWFCLGFVAFAYSVKQQFMKTVLNRDHTMWSGTAVSLRMLITVVVTGAWLWAAPSTATSCSSLSIS
uniref:Interferon-induced transmembrane protein 3 n=1 Tax=Moschus moschiferus TaxID=68415 RepID=A0A8C6CN17_MOSMO